LFDHHESDTCDQSNSVDKKNSWKKLTNFLLVNSVD